MKNYADQGDCYPPRERENAIDGWSIAHAALFPIKNTNQLTPEVPIVTNINFLLTIPIHCQEIRL